MDRAWHDLLQRTFPPSTLGDDNTAFVLIDEQSLEAMGEPQYAMRWPWERRAFAYLIAALHRAGARAIVVDLAFVELSGSEMDELVLGTVAAGATGVTLASLDGELPVVWPPEFRVQHATLFASRSRWGSASVEPDASDGVYRRYELSGSLTAAALGWKEETASGVKRLRWHGGLEALRDRGVPVVPAARFVAAGIDLLNTAFAEVPDFDPAAVVRAIEKQPIADEEIFQQVRGRTVFVGANAAAAFDYISTPVGAPEPGILLHWTAWQNFSAEAFLAESGVPATTVALIATVILIGWIGARASGMRQPAFTAVGAASLAIGGSIAAFHGGIWFAPAAPVAGAATTFTAVAVESFRRERARKREIQGWFGAYVSPAVVKRLVENPDALQLGGERREVSVFFSDLVGFTALSERLPAEQLVQIVNLCLDEVSGCIFAHGGYLDKYIGDAIMGVFGAPEELENHALAACRAALDAQRHLTALNQRLARDHGVQLGMRIGINSGEAVVGNVGSERKRNYTALGDAVNLASRLEGANKVFGTGILLGPLTATRVSGEILVRPVACLRVKGKTQAAEVHEPLGLLAALDENTRRFAAAYTQGFADFCARRFSAAVPAFSTAAELRPDDPLTTRYLNEARRFAVSPPPPDWEPTLNLESK